MNILLVASAFNSLTQRVFADLGDRGHHVTVALADGAASVREAVHRHAPQLIVVPKLNSSIPEDVWSAHTCLIVHPGPPGDRGPSPLDWAMHTGAEHWAVTVLQANAEMDAGDVWASVPFRVTQRVGKSDLYRNEAADAAIEAVLLAVERFASGTYVPQPQAAMAEDIARRPYFSQSLRLIDWGSDTTETVLRKLRAADSEPGVLDTWLGGEWYLHGGHREDRLRGRPGYLLATRAGAICRATVDGSVWIPQMRPRRQPGGPATFKLPAVQALGDRIPAVPRVHAPLYLSAHRRTWTDIHYAEDGPVGSLCFSFVGGAMSTGDCRRLLAAYRYARSRPTSVIVLGGARDTFSNGIDLNVIEASDDPAEESWANVNAMDDLVEAVLSTTDRLVVAALGGNAAAGGVMLALAADEVWCRAGAVLNPHYRLMGLYGSQYWTYTLPRRVGAAEAELLMQEALPLSAEGARRLGLVDHVVSARPEECGAEFARMSAQLATGPELGKRIAEKQATRVRDEAAKPLLQYRNEELGHVRRNLWGPGELYHALRSSIVRKQWRGDRTEVGASISNGRDPLT